MICIAVEADIREINILGKNLYNNFSNIYKIQDYLSDEKYLIIISKEIVINGFLIAYNNMDEVELQVIVVNEDCQSKKIGTCMMDYLQLLTNNKTIILEVSSINEKAINFYKKNNFKIINIRKKYYKDSDALIMKKVI